MVAYPYRYLCGNASVLRNRILWKCGSKSGRDIDKAKEAGLTPFFPGSAVAIEEAKLVFICRKIAYQDLDPAGFLDPSIDPSCYPAKDYHRMYVGAIERVLVQK